MKKHLLSLLLAAVFACCLPLSAGAAENDSAGLEALFAVGNHEPYVSWYGDGTFAPGREVTRGGGGTDALPADAGPPAGGGLPLYGRPPGKWYSRAVNALALAGVFHGYQDGSFRPGSPITRGELVTALTAVWPLWRRRTPSPTWTPTTGPPPPC